MKVFISWSGDKSRAVATALHEWIPGILNNAKPWMSDLDIESGQDWNQRITGELRATSFGIICVTPENQARPWLNYEAGALSKQVDGDDTRVAPLLIDFTNPTDLTGPLTKFHARLANRDGIRRLVFDINNQLPEPLRDEILSRTFDALWPQLSKELDQINGTHPSPQAIRREPREVMEEVLTLVRGIHTAVRTGLDGVSRPTTESAKRADAHQLVYAALTGAGHTGQIITQTGASRVKVITDELMSETAMAAGHAVAREIGLKFEFEYDPDEVEWVQYQAELHEQSKPTDDRLEEQTGTGNEAGIVSGSQPD